MISRHATNRVRSGATLIEVMTALSLAATLMASSFVVLRSSYAAWQAHEADLDWAGNATAVLRHLVRHTRQAVGVSAISASSDTSGSLSVVSADGTTLGWDHSGTDVMLSVNGAAGQPLAGDIQSLSFEGFLADGLTPTTDPNDVQAFRSVITTQQPAGGTRTVSSFTWLRSW